MPRYKLVNFDKKPQIPSKTPFLSLINSSLLKIHSKIVILYSQFIFYTIFVKKSTMYLFFINGIFCDMDNEKFVYDVFISLYAYKKTTVVFCGINKI
jgi:hypothetical protein